MYKSLPPDAARALFSMSRFNRLINNLSIFSICTRTGSDSHVSIYVCCVNINKRVHSLETRTTTTTATTQQPLNNIQQKNHHHSSIPGLCFSGARPRSYAHIYAKGHYAVLLIQNDTNLCAHVVNKTRAAAQPPPQSPLQEKKSHEGELLFMCALSLVLMSSFSVASERARFETYECVDTHK